MANDILEYSRDKIDAEILVLQERIRSLRSARNTFSLIHCLPPEVMTQIFKWVQILYCGYLTQGPGAGRAGLLPKWMKVTHVSQRWRNIAFSSKSLYSTILTQNLKYSEEMMKLSGSAPLSILDTVGYNTEGMWDTKELQKLIVAALPRVYSLYLNEPSWTFLFPHLEKSDLILPLEELYLRSWKSSTPALFPKSLRYLRLEWCPFQPSESLSSLCNLVELSLAPISEGNTIFMDTLLNILDGMPRLISLELSCALASPKQTNRESPITPTLQYINIRDIPNHITEFLPWLTFAPRFTIDLSMKSTRSYVPDSAMDWLPPLLEQVGRHLQSSSMIFRTAKLVWDDSNLHRDAEVLLFEEAEENLKPCVRLRSLFKKQDLFRILLEGIEAFPLDNIESLTVDAPLDALDWGKSPWHRIHTLFVLKEQTSSAFLEYLIASAEAQKGRGSGRYTPFESLKDLSLYDIHYGRDLKSKVQAVLAGRMKRGFKLRKLALHRCNISEDSIKQLSKVVEVVEQHGEKKKGKKINRST
ncbi:hypothetical protein BDN72DRAFT_844408 [Pluteus cervinus]|uniref:Uncharacterized protein n=1 Tax=Pluteus cervinus TaxID=181527 RepID=A0ACD3ALH8_9AGAR|nr:hypothetical protein BDN72DRAFT_844408 [Pluteus cervinus]